MIWKFKVKNLCLTHETINYFAFKLLFMLKESWVFERKNFDGFELFVIPLHNFTWKISHYTLFALLWESNHALYQIYVSADVFRNLLLSSQTAIIANIRYVVKEYLSFWWLVRGFAFATFVICWYSRKVWINDFQLRLVFFHSMNVIDINRVRIDWFLFERMFSQQYKHIYYKTSYFNETPIHLISLIKIFFP